MIRSCSLLALALLLAACPGPKAVPPPPPPAAAPTLTGVAPAISPIGGAVTLHGTNLTGTQAVAFGGAEQPSFTVVSPERIDTTVPPGAQSGQVSVTTPAGTATWDGLVVLPQPLISQVTPEAGAGIGRTVELHGAHLGEASAVEFTGAAQPVFTAVSDSLLTTTVPMGATSGPIRVTTPGGVALSAPFTVRPEPVVTGFDPPGGAGVGLAVGIVGLRLGGATAVRFSGADQPDFTVTSDGRIDTTVPSGALTGPVEVDTPEGTALSPPFTVVPAPALSGFEPAGGTGVGMPVALLGEHLGGASSLSFDGVVQPVFSVVSDLRIDTTVPAGASTGPVTVTTPGGTATSAPFTVIPAPIISGFAPVPGADVGQLVLVAGDHFTSATALTFNGTAQPQFTVLSPTQLRARVPPGATSGPLSVTTPGGTATSAPFVVPTPPEVLALTSPLAGAQVGGCVPVGYTVAQQDGLLADVVVEYDASGLGTFLPANTRRATQAPSTPGVQPFGTSGVPTSAAGTAHTFLWNSSADLPGTTQDVALRVRAARKGTFGSAPAPLGGLTVSNVANAACDVRLSGPAVQPTGSTPRSLATGDFNGDGKPDLLVSNYFGNSVSVSLGRGNGTYQPAIPLALGAQPGEVGVGDFNQDGHLDAVAIVGGSARLLLGDGTGALQQAGTLGGSSASSLLVADVNGDGRPDVLVGAWNPVVFLGNGDGTFQTVPVAGFYGIAAMAVEDLDDDGLLDLVVLQTNSNDASVLRGNGDGTFGAAVKYAAGSQPGALALGDVDGDGFYDLLVANKGTPTLSLLKGQPGGTFLPATTLPGISSPWAARLADLDGDGHLDFAVSRGATPGGGLWVGFGNGDGTFQPGAFVPMPSSVTGMSVADHDGDGVLDLAVTAYTDDAAWVFRGGPDRTFGLQGQSVASNPVALARGDLNGDGISDLVVAATSSQFSVLLGTAGGGFQPSMGFSAERTAVSLALGDVNGDGHLDLLFTGSDLTVMLGNGDGTFQADVSVPAGGGTLGLALADANKDGKLDVLVTSSSGVRVLLGNGNGTFGAPSSSFSSGGSGTQAVAVADVNGDGNPDAVLASLFIAPVSVLLGDGTGNFGAASTWTIGGGANAVAVGDVNGDGKPDLVAVSSGGHLAAVLLGTTPGSFAPATSYPTGKAPGAVAIADVTGDGVVDLVTADNQGGSVSVLRGNGDGTFQPLTRWGVGPKPVGLAVADLDGDGRRDVACALGEAARVVVSKGR